MSTGNQAEFTKATVKKNINTILNRIALDNDKYVYQLIEDMAREKYPEYFRGRKVNMQN